MGIDIGPSILVVGLELEISESSGPESQGSPAGVQIEVSTQCHSCVVYSCISGILPSSIESI